MSQPGNGRDPPKKSWRRYLPSWFSRRKPSQAVPGHSKQLPEQFKDKAKSEAPLQETELLQNQDGAQLMTAKAFQQLIKDRQAERKGKTEETRQEWLGRIPDLKPTDPDSIRDTLFPHVLDYEIPFVKEHLTPYSDPETERRDLKNLMTLRLVSKSLRDSVDKWIEERLLFLMRSSDSSKPRKHAVLNSVDLNLATDFTKLDDVDITGNLRFPLRSIRVGFNDPEFSELDKMKERERWEFQRNLNNRVRILQDSITEFLRKLGDQIWHVDFDFSPVDIYMARYFYDVMIQEWLPLMPHLKWLDLKTSIKIPHMYASFCDVKADADAWVPPRNREPVTGMPTTGEMERFDFDSFFAEDELRICEGVLSANPQVKYFTRELFTQGYTHINRYNDPLVLRLPLEAANIGDGEDMSENWSTLQQISSKNWNLRWIELWLGQKTNRKEGMRQIEIKEVFGFLQQFQTLENVVLHIDHMKIGEEAHYLRLPNLKNFWIEFGPNVDSKGAGAHVFFSLQFLMHCARLRSLIWEDLMDPNSSSKLVQHGPHHGVMMDFNGGRGDVSACNCWDVFPHLKRIYVEFVQGDEDTPWKHVGRVYRERRFVSEGKCDWKPPRETSDLD